VTKPSKSSLKHYVLDTETGYIHATPYGFNIYAADFLDAAKQFKTSRPFFSSTLLSSLPLNRAKPEVFLVREEGSLKGGVEEARVGPLLWQTYETGQRARD